MGIGVLELFVLAGIGLVSIVVLFMVVRSAVGTGNRKSHDQK